MSVAPDSEPIRSCVGCRQRRAQTALVRLTMSATGLVVDGPSNGRGAWLCRSERSDELAVAGCVDAALAKRAFARAWRREVTSDDEDEIKAFVGRRTAVGGHPDAQ